jgi:ElaB/YqjD/DUF883 family membrane-anchored ribosome-binding protein
MVTRKFADAPAQQMEMRLRHLAATLDELVSKAARTGGDMSIEYKTGIATLRARLHEAEQRMATLRVDGNSDWHVVMARVEEAWTELDAAFRKVADT